MNRNKIILGCLIFVFILAVFITPYFGWKDIGSYSLPAKYYAGEYDAKIRASHSYLWGFINSPFVGWTNSYDSFKVFNVIIIFLFIISMYYISGKRKDTLWLFAFTPIFWYMATWISPILLSSLSFLWGYHFLKNNRFFYSGIGMGFAVALWHGAGYFILLMMLFFLWDKKVINVFTFGVGALLGLTPLFLLDFYTFGFPFHSLIKNVFGTANNLLGFGMYELNIPRPFLLYLSIFLMFPLYMFRVFKKRTYREALFLIFSIIFIIDVPQIRYITIIVPVILVTIVKKMSKNQLRILFLLSLVISVIVIGSSLQHPSFIDSDGKLKQDLGMVVEDYPNQVFLVGTNNDDYAILADVYWGDKVKEFVSIQDYNLYKTNQSNIMFREIRSPPKYKDKRREIWIAGGLGRPINDPTNYTAIEYGLSLDNNLHEDFILVKKYQKIYIFKRK